MDSRKKHVRQFALLTGLAFAFLCVFFAYLHDRNSWRMLTGRSTELMEMETPQEASRWLDRYLERMERAGLARGNTSVFSPASGNDLARWYKHVRDQRDRLVRAAATPDARLQLHTMRSFYAELEYQEPGWLAVYPYQRVIILLACVGIVFACLCFYQARMVLRASVDTAD